MKKYLPLLMLFFGVNTYTYAQNQAPTAVFDFAVGVEDLPVVISPLNNDTDPENDNLTFELLLGPFFGQLNPGFGNIMLYDNNQNYNGFDIFFYRVCDDGAPSECSFPTIGVIYIAPTNDAPTAVDDTFTVPENATTLLDVLANDFDIDGDPISLSAITNAPANGTAVIVSNQVAYTPAFGFNGGTDVFRYRMCDTSTNFFGAPTCDAARVVINVIPENDAPVANTDSFITPADNAVLDILANDVDEEGDPITLVSVRPLNTTATLGNAIFDPASQSVTFDVLNEGFCGSDTFEYVICDPQVCDTGMFYVSTPCDNVFMPEGFSPDGDGINDLLVFSSLNQALPASLRVYNRYGDIVYENADYRNDWDGKWQDHNGQLPDGTYFYTIELANGQKHINYLVINR